MADEIKSCKFHIALDAERNPVIEAETEECKAAMKKVLQEKDVILRVKTKDDDAKPKTT